jgi:hypothetical protein
VAEKRAHLAAPQRWRACSLRIDDYSQDASLRKLVRSYNDLLVEYNGRGQFKNFMHSRDFF